METASAGRRRVTTGFRASSASPSAPPYMDEPGAPPPSPAQLQLERLLRIVSCTTRCSANKMMACTHRAGRKSYLQCAAMLLWPEGARQPAVVCLQPDAMSKDFRIRWQVTPQPVGALCFDNGAARPTHKSPGAAAGRPHLRSTHAHTSTNTRTQQTQTWPVWRHLLHKAAVLNAVHCRDEMETAGHDHAVWQVAPSGSASLPGGTLAGKRPTAGAPPHSHAVW